MKRAIALGVMLAIALGSMPARAQEQNRAGVAVFFGDGSVTTRCVAFSEPSISGFELLRRTGLPLAVEFGSVGAAVCRIERQGCGYPDETCFCKCQSLGAGCTYWVYAQLVDGAWRASGTGAAGRQVRDGDVDGWMWGAGGDASDQAAGPLPSPVTFAEACGPASAGSPPTLAVAAATGQDSDAGAAPGLFVALGGAIIVLAVLAFAARRRGQG